MPRKSRISKPMRAIALRLSEEEIARLQRIADENDVTLSWVIRQGAKLYAEDLAQWLEHRKRTEGDIGRRLAAE
jgi:predicted transcriptional regulator